MDFHLKREVFRLFTGYAGSPLTTLQANDGFMSNEIPSSSQEDLGTLSEVDCLYHRGALAHPGRLVLSEDLVSFSPTRVLDRLAGAQDVMIPVDAITEVSAGGINHNLDLYVGDNLHRFSGRGAIRMHGRLMALLSEDTPSEDQLFLPGERVLLQGQAEFFVNNVMAIRGELTLTDQRLRFLPGLGIEQLLWNTTQIDVRLNEIESWTLKGLRRRLHATIGQQSVVIGGPLTPELFNRLEAMLGDPSDSFTAEEVALDHWDVQLRRGPIAHPGELHFTPTFVYFKPTGLLDAMVGVKDIKFAVEDITRLSIRGWPERKLIVRAGHQTFAFAVQNVQERFDAFQGLVRDRQYQLAINADNTSTPRYQNCLDSWTNAVEYTHGEQIILSAFVTELIGESEIRFGWLLLLRTRLLFLPTGGPASRENQLEIAIEEMCRLDGGPRSRQDQILMSTDVGNVRYLVSDKEGVVEDFWSQCRSPTRILAWDTMGPRSLSRVLGKCNFVRITSHGDVVVDMSPGLTFEHESGVALVLPGEPGTSVPLDTWVTIEIGQREGIYQLDSKIIRSIPTPLEGLVPNPEETHLLVAKYPSELRVYNQREGYRVTTQFELRAKQLAQTADGGSWMATGLSFPCTVVDLSIGGCAMEADQEMLEGERVSLNLPLLDQWVEIRATCVHQGSREDGQNTVRYGLEFRELSMAQEDVLHKAVMSMQREALSGDEEEEDPAAV